MVCAYSNDVDMSLDCRIAMFIVDYHVTALCTRFECLSVCRCVTTIVVTSLEPT